MKNAFKTFGIIALVAVIGFSMTTCSNGGGGNKGKGDDSGEVNTRFIFGKKAPIASLSVSGSSRSMISGTTWNKEEFLALNNYYDSLNSFVRSYTPTEFYTGVFCINAYFLEDNLRQALYNEPEIPPSGGGWGEDIILPLVDFANMSKLTPTQNLLVNNTVTGFLFALDNGSYHKYSPRITFTLDDKVSSNHPLRTNPISVDVYDNNPVEARDGNKLSVKAKTLYPNFFGGGILIGFYPGTEYRCFDLANYSLDFENSDMEIWELINEDYYKFLDSILTEGFADVNFYNFPSLYTPMAPIHIPSGAKDIDISVNWYLENIIEQYQGPDGKDDTEDDVFVLARDFWQRLSLNISTK